MLQVSQYWCPGLHKTDTVTTLDVNVKYISFFGGCSSSSNSVNEIEKSQLPLKIPCFQRRYCWTSNVLSLWIKEVMFGVKPRLDYGSGHSLGLLVVANCPTYRLIIDGQQRTITALLGLMAIRDVYGNNAPQFDFSSPCPLIVARLDQPVFNRLYEGVQVSPNEGVLAQSYFMIRSALEKRKMSPGRLSSNLLQRAHFKVYSVEEKLGPQLFQWIQEKSVGASKLVSNSHPGQGMNAVDILRNHVLGFFLVGGEAEIVFTEVFEPLELHCVDVVGLSKLVCSRFNCESSELMTTYLAEIAAVISVYEEHEVDKRREVVRTWLYKKLSL